MLEQEIGDQHSDLGGEEAAVLLLYVTALLNRLDNAGIRARPANAFLFESLHQRRLVESRRRLREMLAAEQIETGEVLVLAQRGQLGVRLPRRQNSAETI